MWDVLEFLNSHQKTDDRWIGRELQATEFAALSIDELLEVDRVIRVIAHARDVRRWNAAAIHKWVHRTLHERNECPHYTCKEDNPDAHLAHRAVTTDQWLTLWRETTCDCDVSRSEGTLRNATFHALYRQFVWDLCDHPDPEERKRVRRLFTETAFTLHELIEFESGLPFKSWQLPDAEDEVAVLSQLANEFLSRIHHADVPWQEWRDEAIRTRCGTWLSKLSVERSVADLVRCDAPFSDWVTRWHEVELTDQRHPLERAFIAGLERSARTFEDWNTVYRLVRSKRVRALAVERMRNQLI